MEQSTAIVWLRRDLRLRDNPALYYAFQRHATVIPVFIWAPEDDGSWPPGGAQRWWLHHSLTALSDAFAQRGTRLVVRRGASLAVLRALIEETGASTVFWNTEYEPAGRERDRRVTEELQGLGVACTSLTSHLLHDPDGIRTGKGDPYKVFTPFWKNIQRNLVVSPPLDEPDIGEHARPTQWPISAPIEALALLPRINWAEGMEAAWTPGEAAIYTLLNHFATGPVFTYDQDRDLPSIEGTSRLSPYLHFGEISARSAWHVIKQAEASAGGNDTAMPFLRQLIWREFSYHLIYHFPRTAEHNLRDTFDAFPWSTNMDMLERWQKGMTGYPIVDAGMRQLWATGWMHNRVRMIVASFLTKHLLTHWLEGARWFWDTLLDANLANNTMGWQWSAGSGADAQPFFRIFNPINQGKKFDPKGTYVRTWVPELEQVPLSRLYEPWLLSTSEQQRAGVRMGTTYPAPIVDHATARERALSAYQTIRSR